MRTSAATSPRFINHSCTPNCYFEVVDKTIWIRAARNIRRGEELTYDYKTIGEQEHSLPVPARMSEQVVTRGWGWGEGSPQPPHPTSRITTLDTSRAHRHSPASDAGTRRAAGQR